ncbi:dienelactone hydrolase family protein [Loigolactobacillus coryniformis]|jgi:phospholipase/carboxylesterase|uniref:alpha/beta hydrolase n=1 Tax=Loigolactobacillus coryniformis TaxID=1610 RepID=UPI001C5FEE3F|nr:dienelactone hydrolase family protein [Loigolactobacillus coryniformis]MDT3391529.1 dienelactone hydrolase family protein [Bacillota bacterium]MBW4802419.1 dienelactone hydrolase family protein [Loigolactobacillus coryniformis subsp. torquens]MBW4805116.1 dienelactone hydrolase family protein [Loigolactobacillus coryniformis subsp. torquens]MCL5458715.1 dienelactone hydrolase family protein [Loigolactobacillus coryniformis]MDN5952484.1 dienelactone hydrolase family protein [Loigolactobacill
MTELNYYFQAGDPAQAPLLMLHGTGGYEDELVPLAKKIAHNSPLLGIRGRLVENGRTRYFAHTATGGFDLNSLAQETTWLLQTIDQLAVKHHLAANRMIVLGYSNGANMAAHAWLTGQAQFKTGLLFHPMQLTPYKTVQPLSDVKIWASHGSFDPIVPAANFQTLTQSLTTAQADFTVFEAEQSHALSPQEITAAQQWLQQSQRL